MTLSVKQAQLRALAEVEEALDAPPFLWLRPEVVVHDHAPPGAGPCPCCGARTAAIVERVRLSDLVVEVATGRRIAEADVRPETWAAITAEAQRHELPFRCSRAQAPLLLEVDDHRHVLASSGNRGGKTTIGLYWLALRILREGGPGRRFWLVASTQQKAHRLLEKLFIGGDDSPPVLPRALVASMPVTHRASTLLTTLLDGTLIDLKHFEGDPGAEKLKSDPIRGALVDEASHLPSEDSLIALRGRCLDRGARLFLAGTPRPDSFLKDQVVDPAEAFERLPADDERRASGAHPGSRWRLVSFGLCDNPWIDQVAVRRELAALNPEDPAVARDFYGIWRASAGQLWRDFDTMRHVHLDEARHVSRMAATVAERTGQPLLDATPAAVRRIFQNRGNPHFRGMRATSSRYILASDINCHPLSTVVLNVTADPRAPEDRSRWHVWVIDCVQSFNTHSLAHGEKLLDPTWLRRTSWDQVAPSPFAGCGMIADPSQFYSGDPTAARHNPKTSLSETWGRLSFDTRAPEYKSGPTGPTVRHPLPRYDSFTLLHRLIREGRLHVSQRCEALVESFLEQQDRGDGVVAFVKSHTKSDRLASSSDALRYGCWAIFHGGHESGGLPAPGSLPRAA